MKPRPSLLPACVLLLLAGCGSGTTWGHGTVTVDGLAPGQDVLCGSGQSTVQFTGSGFLSEHGVDIVVRWTALQGTPFLGGTAATEDTAGTVISDSLFEAQLPNAFGTVPCTVTVILPGQNQGISPPITLEIGGFVLGPFAYSDSYTTVGNVPLVVDAANGVLPNDEDAFCTDDVPEKIGDRGPGAATLVTVVGYDTMTTLGGSVSMAPDGSFTYTPPLGVGQRPGGSPVQDTFQYTIEQPGRPTSTTTVFVGICEVVWFINDAAMAAGDGSFGAPFDSVTSFNAHQFTGQPDDPQEGDWIFVYRGNSGSNPYDDGIVLQNDQKLIGEGVDLVVCGITIVSAGTAPVLTNTGIAVGQASGGPVVYLADRNVVRGLDTDGGFNGILGQGVSGPTWIDTVHVRNCNHSGIRLEGCSGTFQIGDPFAGTAPSVSVEGAGFHGLQIEGNAESPALNAVTLGGTDAHVDLCSFTDCLADGIYASDANLDVENTTISQVYTGIGFETYGQFGPCTLGVAGCTIGVPVPCTYRGMDLQAYGAGEVVSLTGSTIWSGDSAIYATSFSGEPVELAFDANELHSNTGSDAVLTVPTVYLEGIEGGVVVTSMQDNVVVANGTAGGILADGCLFDADPSTGPIETVPGGTLTCGQGASSAQRIQGTSLLLDFSFGSLSIDTFTAFQQGGDASGVENNGGGVTLTITTANVDHVP